jgi:hypothetical protein
MPDPEVRLITAAAGVLDALWTTTSLGASRWRSRQLWGSTASQPATSPIG